MSEEKKQSETPDFAEEFKEIARRLDAQEKENKALRGELNEVNKTLEETKEENKVLADVINESKGTEEETKKVEPPKVPEGSFVIEGSKQKYKFKVAVFTLKPFGRVLATDAIKNKDVLKRLIEINSPIIEKSK